MALPGLSEQQEQVYRLLLKPIDCRKREKEIKEENGRILSGQTYRNGADPDMSDFAVGFYKILYGDILDRGVLLGEGKTFVNEDFAGDTMNSFNSIANATPGAGTSAKRRTPFEKWPAFLQEYYNQYHCLANFWVIPMKLGRQSGKFSRYDAMDICLGVLENDYSGRMACYKDYTAKIPDFQTFCQVHYVEKRRDGGSVLDLYKEKEGEKLAAYATEAILQRACKIATSRFSEKLYTHFCKLNLINPGQ